MTEPKRYPMGPLLDAAGLTESAFSRRVGLSGTSLKNARTRGLVEASADKYACRLGLLPWLIWPGWLDDLERECAADDCDERFVPHYRNPHQKFCTGACRRRVGERRARELGLPSAVAKLEGRRRYYQENGEYERARQRRYDQEKAKRKKAAA